MVTDQKELWVFKVQEERMDDLVHLVRLEHQDQLVLMVRQERKDQGVTLEILEQLDSLDQEVLLDWLEHPE